MTPDVRAALEAYYARYYRDTLGIPAWREHVATRLDDRAHERARLARLEDAIGRRVRDARLLDVGCGTGGFVLVAEEAGAAVWGVDASAEATALATRRVPRAGIARAQAEALPFTAASFDVVQCYSTLEHVNDAGRALAEMLRVLRPGGALYVHVPHRWSCQEGHYKIFLPPLPRWGARAWLRARGRSPAFLDTLRPLTLGEVRALVAAAGGSVRRVLDDRTPRRVGGPLWPLVRLYYRTFGIHATIEVVASRG